MLRDEVVHLLARALNDHRLDTGLPRHVLQAQRGVPMEASQVSKGLFN